MRIDDVLISYFFVKENDRWLDYEYMSILSTSFGFMAVIGYLMYNIPTRCRAYLAVLKGAVDGLEPRNDRTRRPTSSPRTTCFFTRVDLYRLEGE